MEKISSRRHRRFLVLSLPLSDFGSFGGVGSDGLSSLFLSRREKKKKKLSLLAVFVGRRRLHAISPF